MPLCFYQVRRTYANKVGVGTTLKKGELLHLGASLDDVKDGEVALLNAEEGGEAVLGGVAGGEHKLALVLLGNGSKVLVVLVSEEEGNLANLGLEDLGGSIHGEGDDRGELVGGNKLGNVGLGKLALKHVLALVKLLEENDGRGGDSGIRGSGGVCGHTIGDVLVGAGSGNESVVLGALELVKEANNNNLGRVLEVTDGIGIGKLDSWWACGLADVADNGVVGAAALVLCGSAALEELQGRVTADTKLAGQVLVHGGVDGTEDNTIILERGGSLGVLRGELLAVTAPWRKELHKHKLVSVHNIVKVVGGERHNIVLSGRGRVRHKGKCHNGKGKQSLLEHGRSFVLC